MNALTSPNRGVWLKLITCLTATSSIIYITNRSLAQSERIYELEAFIAEESASYIQGDFDPTSRTVNGLFNESMDILEIPRSVTLLTPKHLEYLQIDNLRALSRFGAGTQLINHYGVTGTPIIRGAKGATLLNGMVRSFNLNEMPLSLGSTEALDIVKGPTPPHFSPTHVGGFVNLIPKSPFFDKSRGAIDLVIGDYGLYRGTFDYGGPILLGDIPSAYRVSVTVNREEGYYDRVKNDYESLYFSVKSKLGDTLRLFAGSEFFHFNSNENAGWNRPTQQLIDEGLYIIGEPINITDPGFSNTGNRDLASFPFGFGFANGIEDFNALVVPTEIVDRAVQMRQITAEARNAMLNLQHPDDLARAYGQPLPSTGITDPRYSADPAVRDTLARLMANPNSGYRYTREYFDAGGIVFTTPLSANQVLADENDKSEAYNWVGFMDLNWISSSNLFWENKLLVDILTTEKLSSYGYAIETDQWVFADNFQGSRDIAWGEKTSLSFGLSTRYTFAEMRQDYFAEPFSRRDISLPTISQNSKILAGPQTGPDGLNYWSPDIGANVRSHLFQLGTFSQLQSQITESLSVILSARVERAWYNAQLPDGVDRTDDAFRQSLDNEGDRDLYSLGAYTTYTLFDGFNLYAAAQQSTTVDLTQGGGVFGEDNFADAELLETGFKTALLDDRLKLTLSAWQWEQSRFNDRDAQSEPLEGEGVEAEMAFTLLPDSLYLIASAENQQVRRKIGLGFRALPLDEQGWALNGGVLNGGVDAFPENNPELYYPGFPESTVKVHLIWDSNPWSTALSMVYSEAYWLNFERTLRLPESTLWNARISYAKDTWKISLNFENLTNEDYFLGADPLFASNTLVTKGEPTRVSLQFRKSF